MRDLSLGSLQKFFLDAVLRVSPIGEDASLSAAAEALVLPSSRGMSPGDRLDVYREQFWLRHLPSLEEDFPTLAWVVGGSEGFRAIAMRYLADHPPRTWDLQALGAGLPAYLASQEPWKTDILVREAASLDWAFMEAFDAPDAPPFDPAPLGQAPEEAWPSATISFHPSLRRVALTYPVHVLRDAVRNGVASEKPARADTPLVVWRDRTCLLRAAAMDPTAFALLETLIDGSPLGEACDAVARAAGMSEVGDFGARVSSWFQEWTTNGWVTAVRFAWVPEPPLD